MADPPSPLAANYEDLMQKLKTFPTPLLPPGHRCYDKDTTSQIAALEVHPALEAALHILNHNLIDAHFLVRHMEAPPASEGMMCHAILHRIEGDYDNARAWYRDVASDSSGLHLIEKAWGADNGKDAVLKFVDEVEALKKRREGSKEVLEEKSLNEIMAVVGQCEEKFGSGRWVDASGAWTKSPEKNQKMKGDMIVGGEGFRKF